MDKHSTMSCSDDPESCIDDTEWDVSVDSAVIDVDLVSSSESDIPNNQEGLLNYLGLDAKDPNPLSIFLISFVLACLLNLFFRPRNTRSVEVHVVETGEEKDQGADQEERAEEEKDQSDNEETKTCEEPEDKAEETPEEVVEKEKDKPIEREIGETQNF